MVLVVPKKPLEGVWWKYGLGLAGLQILCWLLLGFKLHPDLTLLDIIVSSPVVYGTFIALAFLPFVLGRLKLKYLMWCGLLGFLVGAMAYFLLALYEPVRRLNGLLPFISFVQLDIAFLSLGTIIEFGHFVYVKVFEE